MITRLSALLFVGLTAALAQNVSSSVRGTLLDPAGRSIPGAACTLTNQATGAALKATSGADGLFVFPNVQAGAYNLQVTAAGFKTLETTNLVVTASEIRALGELTLQLGTVTQAVTVQAESAAIQLASAERAGVITGDELNDIGLRGRDFFALLLMLPGVVDNFSQPRDTMSPLSIRGTFINGGRDNQKNFAVDGITDMDTGSNGSVHFQPNMDAISEIKIMTTNYQAEFGRNSGGVITVISKGGSKDVHGTAYDFYRHESLNANNFFNNRSNTPKSPYRYRISGYSIGGPIFVPGRLNRDRKKLFFFWSQEYTGMKMDYGTRYLNMPTQLEREGNFSQSRNLTGGLIPVNDPLNGGRQFPDNIVPQNRINKLGQSILNFFPLPNYSETDPNLKYRRNYKDPYSGPYPKRQDMVRLDANLLPGLQVYYRFIQDRDERDTPGSITPRLTGMRTGQPGKGQVVHVTNVISPTLVNEFIFGKSRNRVYINVLDEQAVDRSKMGDPPQWFAGARPVSNYVPNVSFGGGQPANTVNLSLSLAPFENWNDIYSFVDNVSKVWRTHTFKAGVYIERTGKFQTGSGNYRGQFSFQQTANNPFDSNHSYANALLGNFFSYKEATARVDGDYWFWNTEWFLQDNWKVTRHLTLDLGVRFYHMPPIEDLNRTISTWDPKLYDAARAPALYVPAIDPATRKRMARDPVSGALKPGPLIGQFVPGSGDYANGMAVGGRNGYPAGLYTTSWLHLGPRVGFAYDLFGNGKTALRGGFGMFKDRPQGNPTMNANGNPPVAYTPALYSGSLDSYASTAGVIGPSSLMTLLAWIFAAGRVLTLRVPPADSSPCKPRIPF